jgi:hypothetical protein
MIQLFNSTRTRILHGAGIALLGTALALLVPANMLGQASPAQSGTNQVEIAQQSYGQPASAGSQQSPTSGIQTPSYEYGQGANTPGTQPHYPGIPPSQNKLETSIGPLKVRFYGTILMSLSSSDSGVFGQDLPLRASPDSGAVIYPDGTIGRAGNNHDLIFTMRQSILGLTVSPANPSENGWVPSALVEMDLFGSRPVDTSQPQNRVFDEPRLRLAYIQLEHKSVKIVAGQDKMILAPLDPVSLSHVAAPLGATAGDLWAWLPQVRVDRTHRIGYSRRALSGFRYGTISSSPPGGSIPTGNGVLT